MPSKIGLSEIELEIMEMVWNSSSSLTFNEIMTYFLDGNKHWKKQTLHTHLSRLVKKGVLAYNKNGNRNIYYPECSREQYISKWTASQLYTNWGGSLSDFFKIALTGNIESLSEDEINSLRDLLNN